MGIWHGPTLFSSWVLYRQYWGAGGKLSWTTSHGAGTNVYRSIDAPPLPYMQHELLMPGPHYAT